MNLLWIPGLGGNEVMFAPILREIRKVLPDARNFFFRYYDVPPRSVKTLEEYTLHLAEKNKNLLGRTYRLATGCSLGGMILQILLEKKLLRVGKAVLLSTAFSGHDLTYFARVMSFLLFSLPVCLRKPAQKLIAGLYPVFRYRLPYAREFGKMFAEFPENVFFEAPRWISRWQGAENSGRKSVLVLHGTKDPLISFVRVSAKKENVTAIEGSHILFATHPELISLKIREFYYSAGKKRTSRYQR